MSRTTSFAFAVLLLAGSTAYAAGPSPELGTARVGPGVSTSPLGFAPGTSVGGASSQSLGAAPGTSLGNNPSSSQSLGAAPGTQIGGHP